jgi:hypothetical protein
VVGPVTELEALPAGEGGAYMATGGLALGAALEPGWYVLRIAVSDDRGSGTLTPKAYAWADIEVVE